ncbi:RNA polymerase sigma factor [Fulvivirgaceae bacterium BMA10]|uniref:RNA polymerase sigma factor n=1 Tax=Splendidivirga corallicola TaxID=3051826 RepID=A0ABT8KUT6_9BACT|nr:RNA polymerase sigma factor [Fulvivirgaceae bacterium BMA10]
MDKDLNSIVQKALLGDKKALESVVEEVKDLIYNLSLKMLLFPEDAQDATQEILVRIITHLSTFQGKSTFKTWVYKVATNYLLTEKSKKDRKAKEVSFDEYANQIDTGQSAMIRYTNNEGEIGLLEEEVKVSCTHGLLHCLNPANRLIYVLGDVLDLNSKEAAEILEITPSSFRKQLSRSRERIKNFLTAKCGLVNPNNSCRCKRKIDFLIDSKMIDPHALRFANHTKRSIDMMQKIEFLDKTLSVFRSVPIIGAPNGIMKEVRQTINSITF